MIRFTAIAFVILLSLTGCEEEASKPTGKASISLELVDFKYAFRDGRHAYSHRRIFRETGGVGVMITRGKVCVQDGAECADALVGYRIEASQTLEQKGSLCGDAFGERQDHAALLG